MGGENLTSTVIRDTNIHTFKIDARDKTWAIDSTSGSFTSSENLSTSLSIFLFARNAGNTSIANKPMNGRIYYCKIWDDDNLVRDFIPVLDPRGIPAMYDKENNVLYYNAGTSNFKTNKTP